MKRFDDCNHWRGIHGSSLRRISGMLFVGRPVINSRAAACGGRFTR